MLTPPVRMRLERMTLARKKLIFAVAGVVAFVIGVASIVIPIVVGANTRTTSSDTIEVAQTQTQTQKQTPTAKVDAYADAVVVGSFTKTSPESLKTANFWRIPVTAPFASMPTDASEMGCGPAQYEWLHANATPEQLYFRGLDVQLRNGADIGASMSIANIHADGELIDQSQVVTLQCTGVGGGGSQIIDLPLDGSPGVWGAPSGWEDNPQPEGSRATLNLAPGQVSEITFVLADNTKRFVGRIVGDLVSPNSGTVVLAESLEIESTPVPGYYLNYANGQLECSRPDRSSAPCAPAEAAELLQEAGRS